MLSPTGPGRAQTLQNVRLPEDVLALPVAGRIISSELRARFPLSSGFPSLTELDWDHWIRSHLVLLGMGI